MYVRIWLLCLQTSNLTSLYHSEEIILTDLNIRLSPSFTNLSELISG